MIVVIRRMVLLVSLMFWQGGLMFYGGVVVPVGGRVLGSETKQGFVTQSVTNHLIASTPSLIRGTRCDHCIPSAGLLRALGLDDQAERRVLERTMITLAARPMPSKRTEPGSGTVAMKPWKTPFASE